MHVSILEDSGDDCECLGRVRGGKSEGHTLKRENVEILWPLTSFLYFQSLYKIEGRESSHKTIECFVLRRGLTPHRSFFHCTWLCLLHHKRDWSKDMILYPKSTTHRLDIRKCGSLWGEFHITLPHHKSFDSGNFTQWKSLFSLGKWVQVSLRWAGLLGLGCIPGEGGHFLWFSWCLLNNQDLETPKRMIVRNRHWECSCRRRLRHWERVELCWRTARISSLPSNHCF